jgi:predicted enzyme related to lactoylglutathione lyase
MTQDNAATTESQGGAEANIARSNSITYIQIPAENPSALASFYTSVFGWSKRGDGDHVSFGDASGYVIGAFVTGRTISREPGILPYVYVDSVEATLAKATANGAEIVRPRYDEGGLWVATIRDPAGNVIGVWQMQPSG